MAKPPRFRAIRKPFASRVDNGKGYDVVIRTLLTTLALAVGIAAATAQDQRGRGPGGPALTLTTPDFVDGGEIPARFTQADPSPISPRLQWTNVPANTVTFVLILHDPDVALQRKLEDALHWIILNIPGTARGLPNGVPINTQLPDGSVQLKNRRGWIGYMGPGAPAAGPSHHYTFELFALDQKLDLGPEATRDDVLKAIDGHILGKAVLIGRFHL